MRKVMASLVRHLHDLCRENKITVEEYMAGLDLVCQSNALCIPRMPIYESFQINAAGTMSNDKRNETQPLLAILDAESLVDEITHNLATSAANAPTATAILGSFWRKDSPCRAMGDTIVSGFEASGNHALVSVCSRPPRGSPWRKPNWMFGRSRPTASTSSWTPASRT